MIVAAIFTSLILSFALGFGIFGTKDPAGLIYAVFSSLSGFITALVLAPVEWIDNKLPAGHFWRDLFS